MFGSFSYTNLNTFPVEADNEVCDGVEYFADVLLVNTSLAVLDLSCE